MALPERADVVIVGGGAAGCALAGQIGRGGDRSILLIEAGPDIRGRVPPALRDGWNNPSGAAWAFDWGFTSEPDEAGSTRPVRRGRLLGGTSWLTRFAVRGGAADFDEWAALGNPGWTFEEVLPTLRRIESDQDFADRAWHGGEGPLPVSRYLGMPRSEVHEAALAAFDAVGFKRVEDLNAPAAVGVGPMPMSTRDGQRVTALDAFVGMESAPPNVRIRPDSLADRVLLTGDRASGIQLADGTVVEAAQVIVAAGTYGSPSLLLRSGIGPSAELRAMGIDVVVDLPGVGANLADHPGTDFDTGWRGSAGNPRPLHSIATFHSSSTPARSAPDLMFWMSDPVDGDDGFYLDPILLKPRARGRVRLRTLDPSDPPRITLPVPDSTDLVRLAEGYRRALEIANRPEFRRLGSEPAPPAPRDDNDLRSRVLEQAYSIPHVVGTSRMGPSPADGDVVDHLGRVHGVGSLFVIDASVIPEPPSGFPHLITLMLAAHLGERIAGVS